MREVSKRRIHIYNTLIQSLGGAFFVVVVVGGVGVDKVIKISKSRVRGIFQCKIMQICMSNEYRAANKKTRRLSYFKYFLMTNRVN